MCDLFKENCVILVCLVSSYVLLLFHCLKHCLTTIEPCVLLDPFLGSNVCLCRSDISPYKIGDSVINMCFTVIKFRNLWPNPFLP